MKPQTNDHILISKLLEAVDLMEFGIALMRQNIARRNPHFTQDQVEEELKKWLFDQPSAAKPSSPFS